MWQNGEDRIIAGRRPGREGGRPIGLTPYWLDFPLYFPLHLLLYLLLNLLLRGRQVRQVLEEEWEDPVEELFEVKVVAVNVLKVQPKPKRRGAIKGTKQGWKKAIVQVRKGDEIQIFQGAQV